MKRLMSIVLLIGIAFAAPALSAPPIQHWRENNGTEVYLVETHDLPIVDVRVVWSAGGARDGELPGLAQLTNGLLDQGTSDMNADEIALALESTGARLSGGSQRDMAYLHLRSLSEPEALDSTIETLSRVLADPSFPPPAVERLRARMLVGLQAAQQRPGFLAERAFYRAIYGDHPYASPPEGTQQSLKAITREDIVAFYRRYYAAGNAIVAVVGDVTPQRAREIARSITGGLPDGPAAPPLPEVPPLAEAPRVGIPFSATQTHLTLGQPAIARDNPDIFAMYVGNHILGGGGLVSLLTSTMREEHGLSYSTSSYFVPSASKGPFAIESQVKAERAGEAIEVLRDLLARFRNEGPTQDQLEAAKLNITGSFPLNLDSNSDIVGYVSMIGFYDLPLDYLDTYVESIEAVTAEDVKRVFQEYLDPDRMALIRVGPQADAP